MLSGITRASSIKPMQSKAPRFTLELNGLTFWLSENQTCPSSSMRVLPKSQLREWLLSVSRDYLFHSGPGLEKIYHHILDLHISLRASKLGDLVTKCILWYQTDFIFVDTVEISTTLFIQRLVQPPGQNLLKEFMPQSIQPVAWFVWCVDHDDKKKLEPKTLCLFLAVAQHV